MSAADRAAAAAAKKVTAADLLDRLRRHYLKPGPMPGGVFLDEVGLNDPVQQRRVDALHVGFTGTSGKLLTGHEIKASRGDWLHELDQPAKADLWADQCHAWYLVTPRDLVHRNELPHGWGLMVPHLRTTNRMEIVVRAAVHTERQPSWLTVRSILANYDSRFHAEVREARSAAERKAVEAVSKRYADARAATLLTQDERDAKTLLQEIAQRMKSDTGRSWVHVDVPAVAAAVVDLDQTRAAARRISHQLNEVVRAVAGLLSADDRSALADVNAVAARLATASPWQDPQ